MLRIAHPPSATRPIPINRFRSALGAVVGMLLVAGLGTAGCTLLSFGPPAPSERTMVRDQLVIHSDFAVPQQHRLIEELVSMRGDVYGKLDLPPSDEPIDIYLFDNAERYQKYLRSNFPALPDRRAFFLKSDTRLKVFAYWGDLVAEDLRHEVTHGYLHAVVSDIPLWLDEGLAEYFESPRSRGGFHLDHARALNQATTQSGWSPDLRRLERLVDIDELSRRDYAECWLWAHMLLNSTPERLHLLRTYMANLRRDASALPLSELIRHLDGSPEAAAKAHLIQIHAP